MANNQILDDAWEFCFDPVDAGLIDQWYKRKPEGLRKASLPHRWGQESNPEGAHIGYYFKSFTIDKKETQRRFCLRFPGVQHHCIVWMNGEELGSHFGGHVAFEFDASKAVKVGEENHLVMRVQHLDRSGKLLDAPASELAMGAHYMRHPYAGVDGGVTLLKAAKACLRTLNVFPDYEADRISVDMRFWNNRNFQGDILFDLTNPDGETQSITKSVKLEKENVALSVNLQFDHSKVWSLSEPHLYTLRVSVPGADPIEKRFGMRGLDVERGIWRLNHAQVKVRGVGYPWHFPFTYTQPMAAIDVRKELMSLKEAGINCIRSCGAPFPPFILDICDEIGLLVLQESTCFNEKSSKEGLDSLRIILQSMVEHDGHHPCIFAWVVGSENGSMVLENGNKLLRFMAEIDPTRPGFSNLNSVTLDAGGSGKIDQGKAWEPLQQQINPYESHKLHLSYPFAQRSYSMLQNYLTSKDAKGVTDGVHGNKSFWERYNYLKDDGGGKVLVDGLVAPGFEGLTAQLEACKKFSSTPEYKELARILPDLATGMKERGLDAFWKSPEDLLKDASAIARQGFGRHLEAMLTNTQVLGWFIEEYSDYGLRLGGLVDYTRQPKAAMETLKRINRPVYVFAEAEERTPYVGTTAGIKIHLVNDGQISDYNLALRVKGPNGRVLHQEQQNGKAKPGYNALGRFKFPVGYEQGRFTFDLTLTRSGKEGGKTEEFFLVPPDAKLDSCLKQVSVFGPFPDTVTCSTSTDAPITILYDLTTLKDADIKNAFDKADKGGVVILACLTEEDTRKLHALKLLPHEVNAYRSAGNPLGSFHYALNTPEFKNLPSGCLLDQTYAEVLPLWSIEGLDKLADKLEVSAGAFRLQPSGIKGRWHWGIDLATLKHGKGKIVFCQFDIFARLGKNALADALLGNLVALHSK